jgi:hypothetical protein
LPRAGGGTTAELAAALPMAILDEVAQLVSLLGIPITVALLGGIWL